VKLFQQLIGLEAKLRQYADGAHFVREIENAGGPELLALAWQSPRTCPAQRRSRRLTAGCHACEVWRSSQRDAPLRARAQETAAPLIGRCSFPDPGAPLACAVSGGADSLALLVLAVVRWL